MIDRNSLAALLGGFRQQQQPQGPLAGSLMQSDISMPMGGGRPAHLPNMNNSMLGMGPAPQVTSTEKPDAMPWSKDQLGGEMKGGFVQPSQGEFDKTRFGDVDGMGFGGDKGGTFGGGGAGGMTSLGGGAGGGSGMDAASMWQAAQENPELAGYLASFFV